MNYCVEKNIKDNCIVRAHLSLDIKKTSGAVFAKGRSQSLGLNLILLYWTFKPKLWLSPFMNTSPVAYLQFQGWEYCFHC